MAEKCPTGNPRPSMPPLRRYCPLINEAREGCYCIDMNSQKIHAAVYYCGGNFEECGIYKAAIKEKKIRRIPEVGLETEPGGTR